MAGISSYILSVTAASILCFIVAVLAGNGIAGKLIKLMTGVVMAVVVIRPVTETTTINLNSYLKQLNLDARAVIAEGTDYARRETGTRIKQELESYILDEAAALSMDITVELTLNDQMLPVSVVITGDASPYARQAIEDVITDELGIPTEALIWT